MLYIIIVTIFTYQRENLRYLFIINSVSCVFFYTDRSCEPRRVRGHETVVPTLFAGIVARTVFRPSSRDTWPERLRERTAAMSKCGKRVWTRVVSVLIFCFFTEKYDDNHRQNETVRTMPFLFSRCRMFSSKLTAANGSDAPTTTRPQPQPSDVHIRYQ